METRLHLAYPTFDDERITESLKKDFDYSCEIYIFKDVHDWKADNSQLLHSVWIEFGKGSSLMFYTDIDDLELFANSILKEIEIFRRDYADEIKEKRKQGALI